MRICAECKSKDVFLVKHGEGAGTFWRMECTACGSTGPFELPLLEETNEGLELPTVAEWLAEGAPMREVDR